MAPNSNVKRVRGVSVYRPFVYGTTAKVFDPVKNPKPEGTPAEHTHSWTVFVKGVDNEDITYWLKKVQFKLHDSIPNPLRSIDAVPGQPFQVSETGWGEFEIQIRFHYVVEAGEKAQALWHNLRLHPYGTEEEKVKQASTEVQSWCFEEQVFNEPFEPFYDILTSSGRNTTGKTGKSNPVRKKEVLEKRTARIPDKSSPGQPYSKEAEALQLKLIEDANATILEQITAARKAEQAKMKQIQTLKTDLGIA